MTTRKEDFSNLNGILKFEYAHGRTKANKLYYINDFYFTCAPKRPRMLSNDKLLFLTILDDYKNDTPRIIGRARTYGFNNSNNANSEMIKIYDWTEHYKYFVKLYNIEVIDTDIINGISLYEIIEEYISKTATKEDAAKAIFLDTKAKNPYRAYTQQSYRMITDQASYNINEKLDKSFKKFGKINL